MTNKTQGHHSICKSVREDGKITSVVAHTRKDGGGRGLLFLSRFFSSFFIILPKKLSLSQNDSSRLFCFSIRRLFLRYASLHFRVFYCYVENYVENMEATNA